MRAINELRHAAYAATFENRRRVHPRLWDADYCLLRGLARAVGRFAVAHARPGMTVVDFGCGAKPYRLFFPADCHYVGVDACANPLADSVIRPDEPVPLPAASVDLIVSTQVVYLIPEYSTYLAECRRLLKPEGRLFLTTHGTWTHHPASGGDYYRFTQDGVRYILASKGFQIVELEPVVGTLGTGLHLRQLIFNSWLHRLHLRWFAALFNVLTNLRILAEDRVSPRGTRLSSPVILVCVAQPVVVS